MNFNFKLSIFFVAIFTLGAEAQKLPHLFGRKKSSTQWYGDPVTENRFKTPFDPYATLGFGAGTSNYYGDFTSYKYPLQTILKTTRWNFSANYTRHLNYYFSARIALTYARIMGDDINFKNAVGPYLDKYSRGLHFRNDLKELSVVGIYNIAKYRPGGHTKRVEFNPYLFLGFGAASHNPKARDVYNSTDNRLSPWLGLRPLDTEGQSNLGGKQYSTIAFSIPFGMGFRFKLSENWDFSVEGGLRYTVNYGGKYLDDVSGNYIASAGTNPTPTDAEKFSYRAPELIDARNGVVRDGSKITLPLTQDAVTGEPTKRGNNRQDFYFLTCFQLNYYIPKKIKCPTTR